MADDADLVWLSSDMKLYDSIESFPDVESTLIQSVLLFQVGVGEDACRWVKLGDFGLTRAIGSAVRAVWYESPFCTPEVEPAKKAEKEWESRQREGNEEEMEDIWITVEPCIDSWALGVLAYCLLTSCFPWEESTLDDRGYRRYKEWFYREAEKEGKIRDGEWIDEEETDSYTITEERTNGQPSSSTV
ncbi:Serine/threonine-protein kinase SBK1 [Collichthys lucidus]|uniref:Serine/threonine-protein kinase SBK1 n=1 Tax=Collichthys lucidus TaxID=240159 RepID=A0A4U5V355_COLLU|nr:Serine/threonine-protein kinase SBK1 [Collichthys lucidus]